MRRVFGRMLLFALYLALAGLAGVALSASRVAALWAASARSIFYRFDSDLHTRIIARFISFGGNPSAVGSAIGITLVCSAGLLLWLVRPKKPVTGVVLALSLWAALAMAAIPNGAVPLAVVGGAGFFVAFLTLQRFSAIRPNVWSWISGLSLAAVYGLSIHRLSLKAAENVIAYHYYRTDYTQEVVLYAAGTILVSFLVFTGYHNLKPAATGVLLWALTLAASLGLSHWSDQKYLPTGAFEPAKTLGVVADVFPSMQGNAVGRVFAGDNPIAFAVDPRPGQVLKLNSLVPTQPRPRVTDTRAALETLLLEDWMQIGAGRLKYLEWLHSFPFLSRQPLLSAALDSAVYDPYVGDLELMQYRNYARDAEDLSPDIQMDILLLFSSHAKRQEVMDESAILLQNAQQVNDALPGAYDLTALQKKAQEILARTGADDRKIGAVKGKLVFGQGLRDPGIGLSATALVGFSFRYPADLRQPAASPLVKYSPVENDGSFDIRDLGFGDYAPVFLLLKQGFLGPDSVVLTSKPGPFTLDPAHPSIDLGEIRFDRGLPSLSWFVVK